MATTVYLTNPTINITQGATTTDFTDNTSSITASLGFTSLETTAFGSTGLSFSKGLATSDISMTVFMAYGAAEIEAALATYVGTGTSVLVFSPAGTIESASNPEFTVTGAMLAAYDVVVGTVNELSVVELSWTGGTWARDVT